MFDVRAQLHSQKGSVLFQLCFSIKVTGANYLEAPVEHRPPPASLRLIITLTEEELYAPQSVQQQRQKIICLNT